jgi:hypothetical protein
MRLTSQRSIRENGVDIARSVPGSLAGVETTCGIHYYLAAGLFRPYRVDDRALVACF